MLNADKYLIVTTTAFLVIAAVAASVVFGALCIREIQRAENASNANQIFWHDPCCHLFVAKRNDSNAAI